MANTYIKILLHIVFAVKNRNGLISPLWRERLYAYISSILRAKGDFPLAIGGTDDHIHIFFTYNARETVPNIVREIKSGTSKYINENRLTPLRFEWQKGYACFSYSQSQTDAVVKYINNQNQHHKGYTLTDEIKNVLTKFGIEYDERYIFQEAE